MTSLIPSRPPGRRTRKASARARDRSADKLITQLEMTNILTARRDPARGQQHVDPAAGAQVENGSTLPANVSCNFASLPR
jgi:hypothetical protein